MGPKHANPASVPRHFGESLFFVSKVPFSLIYFAQISFGKRHFSPFSPQQKAPFFRRISLREFYFLFFAKKIAKNRLDPTHSPKLDHFSPHFAPRKVKFSPFYASRKSAIFRFTKNAIFAAFCSAKKSAIFAKNFTKSRLDPSVHTPLWAPGDDSGQREKKTKSGRISDRKMTAARDPWVAGR
jgi:hypothetical protein